MLTVCESVERGVERVADVDDDFPGEGVCVLGDDRNDAVVQQGRDDDVPGRNGAPLSRRRAAAQSLGQAFGLGLIASHDLDGVAARHRECAEGAGHVSRTEESDAAHEVSLFLRWRRWSRLVRWAPVGQMAVVPPSLTSSRPLT
ncbi:hypothetical protein QFZ64_000665 [Streptomyces sp. B3I8]|nr:hypothetical protein [Streptomyces sp. B3I8]